MVKIKICGITNFKDAKTAVDAGADAIGFIFAKSPRKVSPEKAAGIIKKIRRPVSRVGVFLDAPVKEVKKIAGQCKIDTLQFHGNESPRYCSYFRNTYKVIKTFRIKGKKDLKKLRRYKVDGYLLDTFVKGTAGGTGKVFDWKLAKSAKKIAGPIILSGGLNPENAGMAVKLVRPYAVDVASGVEARPGKKDKRLIKEFLKAVRI